MSGKNWILIVAGLIILAGLLMLAKPKPSTKVGTTQQIIQSSSSASPQSTVRVFELVVHGKKLVSGPETIGVNENDTVTIKITSGEADQLHIHGYDKSVDLEKDKQAEITFVANLTGRFEYELENSKVAIGALEVSPK